MSAICKDCRAEWSGEIPMPKAAIRPIVEKSGGRCATHWRAEKARRKSAAHETRVQTVYGLAPGEYKKLYDFQGGRCAICARANGATRRLSVDHDHKTGLARGLTCRPCNDLLGHLRDDIEAARRLVRYLGVSPARLAGIVAVHKENRKEGDGQ